MASDRLSLQAGRNHRLIVGGPTLQLKVAEWVIERCQFLELAYEFDEKGRRRPLFSALGLLERSPRPRLLAGVVYEGYNGTNINVHVAALPGVYWTTRSFLGEAFRYPFEQLGVKRMTGKTPASNTASRLLQQRLGFVQEGVVREGMPDGDDMVIYGMLKRECRWLNGGKDGFERLVS